METVLNKPKFEAITTLHANLQTPVVNALLLLLDIVIQEAREEMDEAELSDIPKAQGAIAAIKNLKDMVNRGLPPVGVGPQR